MLLGINFET